MERSAVIFGESAIVAEDISPSPPGRPVR